MKAVVITASGKFVIEPFWILNKGIATVGSMAVLHSFDKEVDLFAREVLNSNLMILERHSLESYADALTAMESGEGRRIVMLLNG